MNETLLGPRLLIIGAAPHSLGEAVATVARTGVWSFEKVATAGITPASENIPHGVYEDYKLDVRNSGSINEILGAVCPDIVVCTVGINEPSSIESSYLGLVLQEAFSINVIGVLEVLRHFMKRPGSGYWNDGNGGTSKKFVAISSNSARIPRRRSLAYCASKAALSMALRVAARELAGAEPSCQVWGYEPGLLAGTPMTTATEQFFGEGDPETVLHRMPGFPAGGLNPVQLAQQIVNDVANYTPALNGVMIPFDGGEH